MGVMGRDVADARGIGNASWCTALKRGKKSM